jgi:hypothetical protein
MILVRLMMMPMSLFVFNVLTLSFVGLVGSLLYFCIYLIFTQIDISPFVGVLTLSFGLGRLFILGACGHSSSGLHGFAPCLGCCMNHVALLRGCGWNFFL